MSLQSKWFGFGLDERYDEGVRAFEHGRYEEAVESLGRCLRSTRDARTTRLARYYIGESYARLGRAALEKGDPKLAVSYLESCLVHHPNYADVHLQLSRAFAATGDHTRQQEHLSKALQLNPHYGDALRDQAALMYARGQHEQAMDMLSDAFPQLDELANATELHRSGRHEEALLALRGLQLSTGHQANNHARLADAYAANGDLPAALSEYEKALALQPRYPDVLCRYGQALLQADRVEEALDQFRAAIQVNPTYVEALAQAGIAFRRLGKHDLALQSFEQALEIDPNHVVASYEIKRRR